MRKTHQSHLGAADDRVVADILDLMFQHMPLQRQTGLPFPEVTSLV